MGNTGTDTSTLRIEDLMAMYEQVKNMKRIVIFFSPYITDQILFGEMIDRLLDCDEGEKGYLVPEAYRHYLDEYQNGYVERGPKAMIGPEAIVCPFKFDLDLWGKRKKK